MKNSCSCMHTLLRRGSASVFLAAALVLSATIANAQTSGGLITGDVTVRSGARLAQCSVTLTNTETGVVHTVTSNKAGSYSLPNLTPGPYTLEASAAGFGAKHISGITLTVGFSQVLDISLDVSGHSEQVTVSQAARDLRLETSEVSAFDGGATIRDLPLNGRSWFD